VNHQWQFPSFSQVAMDHFFTQEPPGTSEKGPGEHAAGSRLPAGSPALPSDAFALVEVSRERPSFEHTYLTPTGDFTKTIEIRDRML
jgi:hypothetical protein